MRRAVCGLAVFSGVGLALLVCASSVRAQDPAKVDAHHYQVVFENEHVRVLKVHYGPHEKSVMHSHPNTVAVFLNDATAKFTFPDGTTRDVNMKAGDTQWSDAMVHLPENTRDAPLDVVVIELKGAAKPMAK